MHIFSPQSAHARYLKQSTMLSGLGIERYQLYERGVERLHCLFARAVDDRVLTESGVCSTYGHDRALSMSNRYFTPAKDVTQEEQVVFPDEIDPKGYLRLAGGLGLKHVEDNVVRYYELVNDSTTGSARLAQVSFFFAIHINDFLDTSRRCLRASELGTSSKLKSP